MVVITVERLAQGDQVAVVLGQPTTRLEQQVAPILVAAAAAVVSLRVTAAQAALAALVW